LFQVLREDYGLAYSVHSSVNFFDDTGVLTISAGLDPAKLPKAMELMMRELKRLTTTLPTRKELQEARDYLIGQLDLSLENTENQMMWIGDQFLGYSRIVTPEEIKRRVMRITASQVRQVAKEFFRPERMSVAMVSPLKSARGIEKLLRV
jgi:predicted Zn-dependent peptidase